MKDVIELASSGFFLFPSFPKHTSIKLRLQKNVKVNDDAGHDCQTIAQHELNYASNKMVSSRKEAKLTKRSLNTTGSVREV